jgi:DNA-binding transcriptional regulator YdaS (Cro superfamily)
VLQSVDGLVTSEELRPGISVLGLDYSRALAVSEIKSLNIADDLLAYLVVTSTGESIVNGENSVLTLKGPMDIKSVARLIMDSDVKVERFGIIERLKTGACDDLGCLARMFDLLKPHAGSDELLLWTPTALSNEARFHAHMRFSAINDSTIYFAPKERSYFAGALLHDGPCLGIELLYAAQVNDAWSVGSTAARQCLEIRRRIFGHILRLGARPKYGPSQVFLSAKSVPRFDVVEGITALGRRRTLDIQFCEHSFTPHVGTVPILAR